MRWRFLRKNIFNRDDKKVSTVYTHRGIGLIQVSYEAYENPSLESRIVLTIGCYKKEVRVPREEANKEAKKLYLSYVRHKISNRDIAIVEGDKVKIIDVYSGLSLNLSRPAAKKLAKIAEGK